MRTIDEASAATQALPLAACRPARARPRTTTVLARQLLGSALGIREMKAGVGELRELRELRELNRKQQQQQQQQALDAAWGAD